MKVNRSRDIEAYIPTSSMADIAFLLIIFFMVSSVFPLDKTPIELPTTHEIKNYPEESAIIAVTTSELQNVRNDKGNDFSRVATATDIVRILVSDGYNESQMIYDQNAANWDMTDTTQFEALKKELYDRLIEPIARENERRAGDPSLNPQIIVIKADRKVPYFAVDGVVKALQELQQGPDGASASRVAILSHLPS